MFKRTHYFKNTEFWSEDDKPIKKENLELGMYVTPIEDEVDPQKPGKIVEIYDNRLVINWVPEKVYWVTETDKEIYFNILETGWDQEIFEKKDFEKDYINSWIYKDGCKRIINYFENEKSKYEKHQYKRITKEQAKDFIEQKLND